MSLALSGVIGLYPTKPLKDFSELLFAFEKGLNQILQGDTPFTIQLRDLPVFRRIKSKIEHLPFLKDIFVPLENRNPIPNRLRALTNSRRDYSDGAWLLSQRNRLPPITRSIPEQFHLDEESAVTALEVQTSLNHGVQYINNFVDRFRKFKLAVFAGQPHLANTPKSIFQYFLFVLLGSLDTILVGKRQDQEPIVFGIDASKLEAEALGLFEESNCAQEIEKVPAFLNPRKRWFRLCRKISKTEYSLYFALESQDEGVPGTQQK